MTSPSLFAKVLKTLDILQTECKLIFEPTLMCADLIAAGVNRFKNCKLKF